MLAGGGASALILVGIIGGGGLAIALAPVAETLFIASAVLMLISAQKVMTWYPCETSPWRLGWRR